MRAVLSKESGPPLIIQDRYQYRPERPFSPGAECAGRVAALGTGVTGFAEGDRVVAYVAWGACREYVVAKAAALVPVPEAVDSTIAATVTSTVFHDPEGGRLNG